MARKPNGQYAKGSNNATEGHPVYSVTPRSPRSIFRFLLDEDLTREQMVKSLRELTKFPRDALLFLTAAADYLEGRPKQSVEVTAKRTTNFLEAAPPAALTPPPEEAV